MIEYVLQLYEQLMASGFDDTSVFSAKKIEILTVFLFVYIGEQERKKNNILGFFSYLKVLSSTHGS